MLFAANFCEVSLSPTQLIAPDFPADQSIASRSLYEVGIVFPALALRVPIVT